MARSRRLFTRSLGGVAALAFVLFAWAMVRETRHRVEPPGKTAKARAQRVRILRDEWGIPHIFGRSDADAAFGLAYAHAEDNWPLIQGALVAARGQLALLKPSRDSLLNDYFVQLLDIQGQLERGYEKELSPALHALLEGYAEGLNYYAALHPAEVAARFLPFTGRDIAAGFLHKLPYFEGLHLKIKAVMEGKLTESSPQTAMGEQVPALIGSNSHAVAAWRAQDGFTLLNVNSHQPWEGPVAWYEAQVHSEEGWNMTGGTFPGAPFILHGHNDDLGWAHTVNKPALIDVYRLAMDPSGKRYRWDGQWKDLQITRARLWLDTRLFDLPIPRDVYRSVHGPVLKTDHGMFAFRYAGIGRFLRAPEQWFRMNKAHDLAEWKAAMRLQALPMFNTIYADRKNIFYVYNALLPLRAQGRPGEILPGDSSRFLWSDYLPFDRLPSVQNPRSGFVQNCNSSPFQTTSGPGNPRAVDFDRSFGIEERMTNRAVRSMELFGKPGKISREQFVRYKFDRVYSPHSALYREVIAYLLERYRPQNDLEKTGLVLLRRWDGVAADPSHGAALGVLTLAPIAAARELSEATRTPEEAFREAVQFLSANYGRLDPPLGTVQRLRRGKTDLPLEGGPDVLNAAYAHPDHGKQVGWTGDSFVLIAEFRPDGAVSYAIDPYGESSRPGSPHYADQAPLFVHRILRRTLRSEAEIRRRLEREYHPGEEL